MDKTDFKSPAKSCGSCKFFDKFITPELQSVNICRVKPGAIVGGWTINNGQPQVLNATCWPSVDPLKDWCGEHQKRLDG